MNSRPWITDKAPRARRTGPTCRVYFRGEDGRQWCKQDLLCWNEDYIMKAVQLYEPSMYEMFPWFQGVVAVRFLQTSYLLREI